MNLLVERLTAATHSTSASMRTTSAMLAAARKFVEGWTPVVAASAVRQLYVERSPDMSERDLIQVVVDDVRRYLYPGGKWTPGGSLAQAIVRLAVFWKYLGRDIAIVTTNYDSNFEEFAGDPLLQNWASERRISIRAFVADTPVPVNAVPVYHLHGYIPNGDRARGNLAFSEAGLTIGHERISPNASGISWRQKLLERRLSTTVTIFVATSLRDRTVVDSLIGTRPPRQRPRRAGANPKVQALSTRYGIFSRQGDAWANESSSVASAVDLAFATRLRHLGVEPVRPDFFGQVPQLLNEIVHCKFECQGVYCDDAISDLRYGGRLAKWWKDWRASLRGIPTREVQDDCQELLASALSDVRRRLEWRGRELLKLEIWTRINPDKRELELFGTSNAANRSSAGHRSKIENHSPYVAVQTFCQGFPKRGPMERGPGRWVSHFSVPIILEEAPWFQLPIGVMNLLSNKLEARSCLGALEDAERLDEITEVLRGAGQAILHPTKHFLGYRTRGKPLVKEEED